MKFILEKLRFSDKEKRDRAIKISVIIIFIMAAAFAVRFYNFHDWLYFKMDQSRDAFMTANAVQNGPQDLPLLGPRAGATKVKYGFLRLGPIFYYFQYLSGVIFHSVSPDVLAYPDLFFSIMVLPLLYLFSRIYFNRLVSLSVILMYAFSFLIIEYSRFSWNPNALPFFTILSFFGLLKFLNSQNEKNRKWWIALWATGLIVGSQLHFLGFFCLVGISGLLFIFHYRLWCKREIMNIFQKVIFKKILFYCGIVLAVSLFFYTPVIISDVFKHGQNSLNFIQALSSKPTKQPLSEKLVKNITEQIDYYTMITTSFIHNGNLKTKGYLAIFFTVAIFLMGIYLALKKIRSSLGSAKRDFLMLVLLWVSFFFVLCIPLAFQIRPRFFIFTFAVPFIFLGLIFEFFEERLNKYWKYLTLILVILVLAANTNGTVAWFREQTISQTGTLNVKRTLILKAKDGVTLGQLEGVANYIYQNHKDGYATYFYVKPEHIRPLQYLFFEKNDPAFTYLPMKINDDPKAQYFAVVPAENKTSNITKKFGDNFDVLSEKQFGQIRVYEINFRNRNISDNFRFNKDKGSTDRIFWKDVFGIKDTSSMQIEGGE